MDRPLSTHERKQRKRLIWVKVIAGLLAIALFALSINWVLTPSVKRSVLRTEMVSVQNFVVTINAGGLVVPLVEETMTSEISSQVVGVYVQLGQRVRKGDKLLQLDTQKVVLEIDNITEKTALKDSQINTQRLTTKKTLNELNSRLELLEVDLESRKTKKDRLDNLSSVGAFSSQDLLEAELNVKRTTIEMRQLKQAMVDVKTTSNAKIETLQLEKSILQKALDEQQRLKEAAQVSASRDGVISWLNREEGSSVTAGQTLAKVIDDSRYKIEATLSDFYASQLVPNMIAQIRYQDHILEGRLLQQTPTIENGVMKMVIVLDEPNNQILKNNLRVEVGLVTTTVDKGLALSKGAYVTGRGIHDVFVIKNDVAYKTQIEIGHSSTKLHEIRQGLQENDEVIISDMSDYLHLNQFAVK